MLSISLCITTPLVHVVSFCSRDGYSSAVKADTSPSTAPNTMASPLRLFWMFLHVSPDACRVLLEGGGTMGQNKIGKYKN